MLYSALHIGDCLISIEGVGVKSSADAYKVLKSHYCGSIVSVFFVGFMTILIMGFSG